MLYLRVCACMHTYACVCACVREHASGSGSAGGVTTIQWVAAVSFCSPDYRKWVCDGPDAADTLMGVSERAEH